MEGLLFLLIVLLALEGLRRMLRVSDVQVPTWAVLVGLAVVLFGLWYFGVYDTAAGRCSRGDLGACLVYEAQQNQR